MPEFQPWPKIHRLFRDVIITEKIDGTNAAIGVTDDGEVYAQSRKRIITPEFDNFGFARFVHDHEDELREALGPGLHFGEWYGNGIQRGYGCEEKRFALFNVDRWLAAPLPDRVETVPLLRKWTFDQDVIQSCLVDLEEHGSWVSRNGWTGKAEGIVIYHVASNTAFKVLLENDDISKTEAATQRLTPDWAYATEGLAGGVVV